MKIFSRKYFACGLFAGVLGLRWLWRGLRMDFDNSFLNGLCCVVLSVRLLYVALNEDACEKDKAKSAEYRNISRGIFGKWAPIVLNIGWAVTIGAVFLPLADRNLAGIALLLMLAGVWYEIIIDQVVKKRM